MAEQENLYDSMTVEQLEERLAGGDLTEEEDKNCRAAIDKKMGAPGNPVQEKFGGIGRILFILAIIVISIVSAALAQAVEGAAISSNTFLLMSLPILVMQLIIIGLRYRNIGFKPIWALLAVVPVVNIVVFLQCLIYPPGYKASKKLDMPAKIFGGLALFLLLLLVLAAILG